MVGKKLNATGKVTSSGFSMLGSAIITSHADFSQTISAGSLQQPKKRGRPPKQKPAAADENDTDAENDDVNIQRASKSSKSTTSTPKSHIKQSLSKSETMSSTKVPAAIRNSVKVVDIGNNEDFLDDADNDWRLNAPGDNADTSDLPALNAHTTFAHRIAGRAAADNDSESDIDDDKLAAMIESSSSYFQEQHSRHVTSNETLDSIELLTDEQRRAITRKLPVQHAKEKKVLADYYEQQQWEWKLLLAAGQNLCFYGVGSKKHLLTRFLSQHCNEAPFFVVNGYHPALTLKLLLQELCRTILKVDITFRNVDAAYTALVRMLSVASGTSTVTTPDGDSSDDDEYSRPTAQSSALTKAKSSTADGRTVHVPPYFYLFIHNIDGAPLRNAECQDVLSKLSELPRVRLVCSIDHINAQLLWDARAWNRYRFGMVNVTNYSAYDLELQYSTSVVSSQQSQSRAKGIDYVLQSLTPRHVDFLRVLAKLLVDKAAAEGKSRGGNGKLEGVSGDEWKDQLIDAGLYTTDIAFRSYLVEFTDHHIIEASNVPGQRIYTIPYPQDIIEKQILQR